MRSPLLQGVEGGENPGSQNLVTPQVRGVQDPSVLCHVRATVPLPFFYFNPASWWFWDLSYWCFENPEEQKTKSMSFCTDRQSILFEFKRYISIWHVKCLMLETKTLSPLMWTLVWGIVFCFLFCNKKTLFSNCQILFSLMIFNELWYTLSFAVFSFMYVVFFNNSKYLSEVSLN